MAAKARSCVLSVAIGAALFVLGCEKTIHVERRNGPATFSVEVVEGDIGSSNAPLAYTNEPLEVTLTVKAIGKDGLVDESFNGEAWLDVAPRGKLAKGQDKKISFTNGVAEDVVVGVRNIHGSTSSIWVEYRGDSEELGNWATGLSPRIQVGNPTIHGVQQTDRPTTSPLIGDFVELDLEGRQAVVTGVMQDGFYVTDATEPTDAYNGLFVYSHSRPRNPDGSYLKEGDVISRLAGTVEEFFGFTELGFPSWKVDGNVSVPKPAVVASSFVGDDNEMEKYESRLVEVRDVKVCPLEGDRLTSYRQYAQWTVVLGADGSCQTGRGGVSVVSRYLAPSFDPMEHGGQTLTSITGNLRYHSSARPNWIIYVRGESDIVSQ